MNASRRLRGRLGMGSLRTAFLFNSSAVARAVDIETWQFSSLIAVIKLRKVGHFPA